MSLYAFHARPVQQKFCGLAVLLAWKTHFCSKTSFASASKSGYPADPNWRVWPWICPHTPQVCLLQFKDVRGCVWQNMYRSVTWYSSSVPIFNVRLNSTEKFVLFVVSFFLLQQFLFGLFWGFHINATCRTHGVPFSKSKFVLVLKVPSKKWHRVWWSSFLSVLVCSR